MVPQPLPKILPGAASNLSFHRSSFTESGSFYHRARCCKTPVCASKVIQCNPVRSMPCRR
jgi:hypothetical protein